MIEHTRRQLGYEDHFAAGVQDPVFRMPKTPGASTQLGLRQFVPAVPSDYKADYPRTVNQPGNEKRTLGAALLEHSKVAKFGAHIVEAQSAPAIVDGDMPILYSRNQDFRIIRPAQFAIIADGDNVVASTYPVLSATAEMFDAPSAAVMFTVSRADSKQITEDQLEYEIMDSIARGLAREADRVLTAAVLATTPANFTLALAAAAGVNFKGLRGLVGTNGTAAEIRHDGVLVAEGIEAELTDVMIDTIVGAWENSAVFISDDIHLIMKRASVDGSIEVSLFVNMVAAIPDDSLFWTGAA
ncbi:MAG: hypothetical protein M8364_11595 [Methylobacter sp.]|uniref:hypothetical protein n=1 Tax=Methylobacter sp. TaxID=2051955 RepID=UPI002585A4C5|nr:hypothetical protein [Methylobacter sp.]MCL7421536.1 hypothetical protein [Methylobacter sp.]